GVNRKNRSACDQGAAYSGSMIDEHRTFAMCTTTADHNRTHAATERTARVARACRLIEASETPPSLSELAAEVGMSPFHFHRLFKAETGLTPKAYGAAWRARRLRAELGSPEAS